MKVVCVELVEMIVLAVGQVVLMELVAGHGGFGEGIANFETPPGCFPFDLVVSEPVEVTLFVVKAVRLEAGSGPVVAGVVGQRCVVRLVLEDLVVSDHSDSRYLEGIRHIPDDLLQGDTSGYMVGTDMGSFGLFDVDLLRVDNFQVDHFASVVLQLDAVHLVVVVLQLLVGLRLLAVLQLGAVHWLVVGLQLVAVLQQIVEYWLVVL